MELQRFPIGSAPLCIPVRDSSNENPFTCSTTPLVVQRPTQLAFTSHAPSPRNENLMNSGSLGQCNDPDCLDCSMNRMRLQRSPALFDSEGGGWMKKIWSSLSGICVPVMNPHAKAVRRWNQFFAISCLIAIFVDPLFFFVLSMDKANKCIVYNWDLGIVLTAVRSATDAIYLLHILLQFRMAYVDPESRVVGTGDLVDEPKKIAMRYLRSALFFDLFVMLPVPQVMIMLVITKYVGVFSANYAKNLLLATVILQYALRIFRFVSLLGGQSANGFIFESAWANFVINLLIFIMAGHVVGSCWYILGLQNVYQCLQNACNALNITSCAEFINCGYGINELVREKRQRWFSDSMSRSCFDSTSGSYKYGIYEQAVLLTAEHVINRYIYSLFWGFQQISTLAGNLVPSYFIGEVLFTKAIIALGLLLFALLIANMQNFLQSLGKRRVRNAERFNWVATRGVNEEELLSDLPEDIQRDIQHHFFRFLDKIRLFTLKDCPIWDAICHKLKHNLEYISGSDILCHGRPVEKVIFIVRGTLESIAAGGSKFLLHKGAVCGEELLMWYLEKPSLVNKDGGEMNVDPIRWMSMPTIRCLTNVEAFVLQASDLEEVTSEFSRFLCNPFAIAAIRSESPYWRTLVACRIQISWRRRQRRQRALAARRIQIAWRHRQMRQRALAARRIQIAWRHHWQSRQRALTPHSDRMEAPPAEVTESRGVSRLKG